MVVCQDTDRAVIPLNHITEEQTTFLEVRMHMLDQLINIYIYIYIYSLIPRHSNSFFDCLHYMQVLKQGRPENNLFLDHFTFNFGCLHNLTANDHGFTNLTVISAVTLPSVHNVTVVRKI